ncbi:MAG: hypothetical protein ACK4PK_02615 [Alphaproteobacteria bacterium]
MSEEQVKRLLQQVSGLHETLEASFRNFKQAQDAGINFDLHKLEQAADLYWQLRSLVDALTTENNPGGAQAFDLDFV